MAGKVGGIDAVTAEELKALVGRLIEPFAREDATVTLSRLVVNLCQRERDIGKLKARVSYWRARASTSEGTLRAHIRNNPESTDGAVAKRLRRSLTKAVEGVRQAERRRVVEEAVRVVEAHSCVSSCCEAQPGSETARELAACLRTHFLGSFETT